MVGEIRHVGETTMRVRLHVECGRTMLLDGLWLGSPPDDDDDDDDHSYYLAVDM